MEEVFLVNIFIVLTFSFLGYLLAKLIEGIIKTYQKKISEEHITTKRLLNKIILPTYLALITGFSYYAITTYALFLPYKKELDAIFFIALIVISAVFLSRTLTILINLFVRTHQHLQKAPHLISVAVSVIIYTVGFYLILKYFHIEVTPYLATLGIGGLAVGLALQGTLSNFFSGLHLISDKPINVGDYIEIDETAVGWVEDIGSISTRIKTRDDKLIIVPNNKIANSIIYNSSLPIRETKIRIPVGVAYTSNLEKVEKITIDVARQIQQTIPGAIKSFEPFIRYNEFADSNINFNVTLKVERAIDKYTVRHEFIKKLKARYDKEKIEISWPVRKIVNT